jgi:DNA-directed RNA polymerase III subunit RPC1
MNVTLGVPRIQEVMNAVKTIKTPVIDACHENDRDEKAARGLKGMIDRVLLGQVARSIEKIQSAEACYIEIELNEDIIEQAEMGNTITLDSVRRSIAATKKLAVREDHISISNSRLQIMFPGMDPSAQTFVLEELMLKLPHVAVSGIEGVSRVIISPEKSSDGGTYFKLFIEGRGLLNVMTTTGIQWTTTTSNHICDVEKVLGIEAARTTIMREIENVYKSYSLSLDRRHLGLLADIMTLKGSIHGMNRHGLAKTSTSSLKLASFEVTGEHLFNAGFYQVQDAAEGASTSVILGGFTRFGSGMMDILVSRDLIPEPVLTPGPFLTPQNPSVLRDQIQAGTFNPLARK